MSVKNINLPTQLNLDQFISTQAHDLRTPFNHIIGFSKMTINTVSDSALTDLQKEDLGTIYRSGLRALAMMNGLIDAARINRHEKELHYSENNIKQLMDQSSAKWKKNNPDSDLQTKFAIRTKSEKISADGMVLQQVVSSFIEYVALFCDGKATAFVTIEEEPNWFVFTWTSSGKKTSQVQMLDLELFGYINRALIELHKGKLRKNEENDEGAIIQFALPKG